MLKKLLKLAVINGGVFLLLLLIVELAFGNWIRPMGIDDLKRFSIPIGVEYRFDATKLYESEGADDIRYTRDSWGLRGSHKTVSDIDVLTVGGSTTDQKFLDDKRTWQAVAERELRQYGTAMIFANAGVDGQSTTGHLFDFEHWFPLLDGLKPKLILFYTGTNDVMRHDYRIAFDSSVDATSWRVKSATWQLVRLVRGGLDARNAQVVHGRKPPFAEADFSEVGVLDTGLRDSLAREVTARFVHDIEKLRKRAVAMGGTPVFLTQTAFAWNGGAGKPRGLIKTRQVVVHGQLMNYADVSFIHQRMNEGLLGYCREKNVACFDVANDVKLDPDDYYDWVHTTPGGAEKVGRYIAQRIAALEPALLTQRRD